MINPAPALLAPDSPPIEFLAFEQLLAELSASFVNLPPAGVDEAITDALRRIAGALGADRCNLVRFLAGDAPRVTHTWSTAGVPAVKLRPITGDFPWLLGCIRGGHPVVVPRLADLPAEAATDRATWKRGGVKSNLTLPMTVGGRVEGAIAIASLRRERQWPEQIISRLRVIADVFGNALAHKRAQEALDSAMEFERLVSGILAALLTATDAADRDRVIEAGLGEMGRLLGAEGATLWTRNGSEPSFRETHRWIASDRWAPPDRADGGALPWIATEVVDGAVVRFAGLAELPPAAGADLPALRAVGVRSMMVVPLMVSRAVVRALCFATASRECDFPDALVPRVRVLGEVFASVLARDEAERREQEARAQAVHATRVGAMGAFAASLAHELTQPLAASLANAETGIRLLAAPEPDLDELRATLADIVADERRAGELVQKLRRFLRRGEVERALLAPAEVLEEVLRLVGREAAARGVRLRLEVADGVPAIVGDRVQLQQVALNLLSNAIDAAAAGARAMRAVNVLVSGCGDGASIEVRDSGAGMAADTIARIFQPFFTTKPKGMGLGLAISRAIVEAHGGTLSVRSTPGEGSTFRIELPAQASPGSA